MNNSLAIKQFYLIEYVYSSELQFNPLAGKDKNYF